MNNYKAMTAQQQLTPPAIGEIWHGQGGIYAGIIPSRNGAEAYHLIIGEEIGRFEWGPYGEDSPAKSLIDGRANTVALVEVGGFPAAEAAALHTADGHSDFYLPAIAELNEAWMNLGGNGGYWVWSSSQRSAYDAFILNFEGGFQISSGKISEFRVRPVRRFLQ